MEVTAFGKRLLTLTYIVTFTLASKSSAFPSLLPRSWREPRVSNGQSLDKLLGELDERVTLLISGQKAQERHITDLKILMDNVSKPVAFTVSTSASKQQEDKISDDDDLPYVFDHVLLDSANGYDKKTGLYTAPMSGNYALTIEVTNISKLPTAQESEDCPQVALHQGARIMISASTCFNNQRSASNYAALWLDKGDSVYAQMTDSSGKVWWSKNNVRVAMSGRLL